MWFLIVLLISIVCSLIFNILYWVLTKKGTKNIKFIKTFYIVAVSCSFLTCCLFIVFLCLLPNDSAVNTLKLNNYLELIGAIGSIAFTISLILILITGIIYRKQREKSKEILLIKKIKDELSNSENKEENLDNEILNKLAENNHSVNSKGKMITKYNRIMGMVFGISSICLLVGIIGGVTKIMALVYSFGIIGILGIMYGCLMIKGRRKICPNCGDCVGKEIDTKYMGTDVKTKTRQIGEEDAKFDTWKTNVSVTKNDDGTYSETSIENIHHYEHTLRCEKCGHIWTIEETKKVK